MEGKLIKMVEGYTLSLTGSIDDLYGISDKQLAEDHQLHKLSIKNCEAIANGYDLDELAGEYANKELNVELTSKAGNFYGFSSSFKEGFQKALEILGDKKFSEEDVKKTLYLKNGFDKDGFSFYKSDEEIIQSLQQTEWDVEIEMGDVFIKNSDQYIDEVGVGNYSTHTKKPKLDADGCLILKRK